MAKKIIKRKGDVEIMCIECEYAYDFCNKGYAGYEIMCKCKLKEHYQLSRVPKICRIAKKIFIC